ncbi:hypothetical protein [Amycolatopsis orientalis]|uniref:hypothetical protein n=1 Tax=Amycolatopsis orientalis TaxID=31958 RepID=UPI00039B4CDD|nr:hypothetical protein [Amycolatopsis orientalis]
MDRGEGEGQTMTSRIIMARPLLRTVGETRHVTHLFAEPEKYPWRVLAFCGAAFWSGDLEWLDGPAGMPCTACLTVVPTPRALP